eukprot:8424987-Lingulodinium_polyedra.AAC.1
MCVSEAARKKRLARTNQSAGASASCRLPTVGGHQTTGSAVPPGAPSKPNVCFGEASWVSFSNFFGGPCRYERMREQCGQSGQQIGTC